MRIYNVISLLGLASGETIQQWLSHGAPNLDKSVKLARQAEELLNSVGDRHFIVIFPENKAWEKDANKKLYKEMSGDPEAASSMILNAIVEVPRKVKSYKDLNDMEDLETLAGTPIVLDKKAEKVYYGRMMDDGTVKREKHSLPINKKPVAVLDQVTIFKTASFFLPSS